MSFMFSHFQVKTLDQMMDCHLWNVISIEAMKTISVTLQNLLRKRKRKRKRKMKMLKIVKGSIQLIGLVTMRKSLELIIIRITHNIWVCSGLLCSAYTNHGVNHFDLSSLRLGL